MRWIALALATLCLGGCTNAPQALKDADSLALSQLQTYNLEVFQLVRNNRAIIDAKFDQGLLSKEERERQVAALEIITRRGLNLLDLERAINAWLGEDLEWSILVNEAKNAIVGP